MSASVSFMYALMKAIANDDQTEGLMEVSDGKVTERFAQQELDIYHAYNLILKSDEESVSTWAGKDQSDKNNQSQLSAAQTKFQGDSTEASAEENDADQALSAAQNQTQGDGTNLAAMAQFAQQVNSVMGALSNLLGNLLR